MLNYHNSKSVSVVVVGSGLAGLTAAVYLAQAGREVTLFEKAHDTGGRAMSNHFGEFTFNMGAHALYRKGPAEAVLKELGVGFTGGRPANSGYIFYQGQPRDLYKALNPFSKNSVLGFGELLQFVKVFGGLSFLKERNYANVSFEDWLAKRVSSEAVRQILRSFNRTLTYTNAPDIQSADQFILQGKRAFTAGVFYIDGGWQTLVNQLREKAGAAGVKIITGQRVEEVEGADVVEGVRLASGEFYPANAVVIAASPVEASRLVRNGTHPALQKWAELAQPARAASLDVALRRLPRPERRFVMGVDTPLYYSVHSAYAKLGPAGKVVLNVSKYLRPDEKTEARQDEQELETFLDQIQPGWREEVLERRFLPHMIVSNFIPLARQGGMAGRPTPQVPGIANLYLAGDWVPDNGLLLDAVMASARQAAQLLISQPALESEEKLGKQPAGSL